MKNSVKKILVVNSKGGCGKTTVATNLASYYALWEVPVALVDYDVQHSSLDWLSQRGNKFNPIKGVKGSLSALPGIERVVVDAPARISPAELMKLFKFADKVLLPVLPSPIDIRAAGHFIGELVMKGLLKPARVGIVANRVRKNTLMFRNLERFLRKMKIPLVTHLRDGQNYVKAAEGGYGVLELPLHEGERDIEQWRPLIKWVEK